jgi:hypothetical protein
VAASAVYMETIEGTCRSARSRAALVKTLARAVRKRSVLATFWLVQSYSEVSGSKEIPVTPPMSNA